jgi:hypothetical protein
MYVLTARYHSVLERRNHLLVCILYCGRFNLVCNVCVCVCVCVCVGFVMCGCAYVWVL